MSDTDNASDVVGADAQTRPVGRPTKYDPKFVEQAAKLCGLGATDRELADFFKVDEATLYRWRHTHPEFCESLKSGKEVADERVERSLYRRAVGYSHDAVKIMQHEGVPVEAPYIEHIAPDVTACIFWLKNRRRQTWCDKIDHEVTLSLSDRMREILAGAGK